ncbi:MAG TPA: STN domain-containing protein [Steroidobacteraceae bacterium]|jgi:hypothetical protein
MLTGDNDQDRKGRIIGRLPLHIAGTVPRSDKKSDAKLPKKKFKTFRQVAFRHLNFWWPALAAISVMSPFFIFQPLQRMAVDISSGTSPFGEYSPAMTHALARQRAMTVDDSQQNPRRNLPVDFHVAAGDSSETLVEFAMESGDQLLFEYSKVHGRPSKGVRGRMTPLAAMHDLVEGTGLMFTEVKPDVIAVVPVPTASGQDTR